MKTKLILYAIVLCVSSCIINEDALTKQRINYNGNEFKTGGCYLHQLSDTVCHYYFFYRNGIRLDLYDSVNINSVEQFNLSSIKSNYRMCWAIFSVEKNIITSTSWTDGPLFYFDGAEQIKKDYFKIENDSTLSTINTDNKTVYYHFKKFVSKPDSINDFIK
jgi:hypothetical protein